LAADIPAARVLGRRGNGFRPAGQKKLSYASKEISEGEKRGARAKLGKEWKKLERHRQKK